MATETILVEFKVNNKGAIQEVNQFKNSVEGVPVATKKASAGLGGLSSTMSVMAPIALAAGAAMYKLAGFVGDSVNLAASQDRVFGQLANSMANVGVNYNEVSGELQNLLSHLQATTKYGDDASAAVLTKLINVTGDYNSALKLLQGTLDVSVAMDKDAAAVAEALGRAVTGNYGALTRYGISLDETTKKQLENANVIERAEILQGMLNERFGGAAQADVQNYAGQIQQMGNYWGDFKEAIGASFIILNEGIGIIPTLTNAFMQATEAVISMAKALTVIANTDWDVMMSVAADAVEGGFKAKLMDVYLQLSQLPGDVGSYFLDKAVEVSEDLETLGGGMERALEPGMKAAEEVEKRLRNLIINGLKPAKKDVDELADAQADAAKRAKEWEKILGDLEKKLDFGAQAILDNLEFVAEYKEGVQELVEELDAYTESMDVISSTVDNLVFNSPLSSNATKNRWRDDAEDTGELMGEAITVALLGEWDNLFDILGRKWSEFFDSAIDEMVKSFNDAFTGDGDHSFITAFEDGWKAIKGKIEADPFGSILTGVGGAYAASQGSGGWGGALQGALSGGMAGLGIGTAIYGSLAAMGPAGWIIAGVLALVGGVAGFMGGGDITPETEGYLNLNNGMGGISRVRDQEMPQAVRAAWIEDRLEEWKVAYQGMFEVLRIFNDPELFEMLSIPGMWVFNENTDANMVAELFREQIIPDYLTTVFETAINKGLGDLGMSEDAIDKLWRELDIMGADRMVESLGNFVRALTGMADLIADMDWDAMLTEVGENSMDTFRSMISQTLEAIDIMTIGLDKMDFTDRANTALEIEGMVRSIRQSEIEMLRQIDQMQKQINMSIERQIEGIIAGGLEGSDKENFYIDRVNAIMADLADGVESPEELARLMSELQSYTQTLQSVMGDRFYELGYDQYVIDALTWANDMADTLFAGFRDEIQASNQDIVDELLAIYDLLTNWHSTITDDDGGTGGGTANGHWQWNGELGEWEWVGGGLPTTPPPTTPGGGGPGGPFVNDINLVSDVNVNSIVTVVPSELFTTYVQSVVNAEINRRNQLENGIN